MQHAGPCSPAFSVTRFASYLTTQGVQSPLVDQVFQRLLGRRVRSLTPREFRDLLDPGGVLPTNFPHAFQEFGGLAHRMIPYHTADHPDVRRISSDDIALFLRFLEVPYRILCGVSCCGMLPLAYSGLFTPEYSARHMCSGIFVLASSEIFGHTYLRCCCIIALTCIMFHSYYGIFAVACCGILPLPLVCCGICALAFSLRLL
jgi:hypothetical protein